MALRRNVLGPLIIELKPRAFFSPELGEFSIRLTVRGREYGYRHFVLHDDELRSRFDQLFDIAKDALRREIMREVPPAADAVDPAEGRVTD